MGWKEVATGLGTEATVRALRAAKGDLNKRQYKRLIATAVAQILEEHPDLGPRKARKHARRLTGARPSKKLIRAGSNLGLREGTEGAVAAAAAAGVAKVVGLVGGKVKEKLAGRDEESLDAEQDGRGELATDHAKQPSDPAS